MTADSRISRLLWFGFALVVLLGGVLWARHVALLASNDDQRNIAAVSTSWGMHACLVAAIGGLGGVALPLGRILGRRRCLTALALFVTGYLACNLAPSTNRIYFDEHIYMQIGQTLAHTGRAELANYARVEYGKFEIYSSLVNKQPNGQPYLLSWAFRIFGVSDRASHCVNPLLIGLGTLSLYLALSLVPWGLPTGSGLAAALLFAFTPLVMWWGHTVSVEPSAVGTTMFAFFAACAYARLRDTKTAQGLPAAGMLLAGATAFAVYFRPESLLVFPLVAAVLWSTDDRFIEDLSAWGALLLATALALPNLMHLWSVRTEDWGAHDGRRFAYDFVTKNLASNGGYFYQEQWFPLAGTILVLAGVLWLLVRNRTAGIAVGLWFVFSWGIFIIFYAGGYYYGASSRYGVISCAPVAVLMGIGFTAIYWRLKQSPVVFYGLIAAGFINWVAVSQYVPTFSREAAEARADVDFVAEVAPTLPKGSLVISTDPCLWLLQEVNSSQYFAVDDLMHNAMRELANQYPAGVYLHWGFWQNAEPNSAKICAQLLAETHAVLVRRSQSQRQKVALYRIDTPEAFARFGGKIPPPPQRDTDLDKLLGQAQAQLTPMAPAPTTP